MTKPFPSLAQEAWIALLLTTERVRWPLQTLLQERGDVTQQQYNVLRILRGAGAEGLPTLEIATRMVERTPGITRMIDRLEAKGLVERVRSVEDRRQVRCVLTADGRALVRRLDRPVSERNDELLSALSQSEIRELIRYLLHGI